MRSAETRVAENANTASVKVMVRSLFNHLELFLGGNILVPKKVATCSAVIDEGADVSGATKKRLYKRDSSRRRIGEAR